MPYLLILRKGAYGFQYIVYILNALVLFQQENIVAETMGKTFLKKNIFFTSCSEEGDDENEETFLLMQGYGFVPLIIDYLFQQRQRHY